MNIQKPTAMAHTPHSVKKILARTLWIVTLRCNLTNECKQGMNSLVFYATHACAKGGSGITLVSKSASSSSIASAGDFVISKFCDQNVLSLFAEEVCDTRVCVNENVMFNLH